MHIPSAQILAGGLAILPTAFACEDRSHYARSAQPVTRDAELLPRADTADVPRPKLGDVPYGVSVEKCTVPGKAAITYDDGPYKYTSELLDILKKNGVKATFFVNGDTGYFDRPFINDASGPWPGILKRMIADGHQVASHSWSHQDFVQLSPQRRKEELVMLESAFVDILGFFPTYFRPPFTEYNDDVEADLIKFGYHNINFDINMKDHEEKYDDSRSIFSSALDKRTTSQPFITLMHDNHERSVTELTQWVIDESHKHGFELVTVGECLGDHPNNWYRDPATGGPRGGSPPAKPKVDTTSSSSSTPSKTSASTKPEPEGTKPASTQSVKTATATSTTLVVKPSTTLATSEPTAAVTTTPAAKPNLAARVEGILSAAEMMFLGVFALFACL